MVKKLILCIVLILLSNLSYAAGIYVDSKLNSNCTNGNYSVANRNCSGSDGNAYNTISKGESELSTGETLFIRQGTYTEHGVIVKYTGGEFNMTTIQAYNSESVTIHNTTVDTPTFKLAQSADGIAIKGIKFTGTLGKDIFQGIGVGNSSGFGGYVVVDNCEFSNFAHGGVKGAFRWWVKNSYFHDIGYSADGGGSKDHAIYTTGDFSPGNEAIYEYNRFENITGAAIHLYNGSYGMSYHIVRYNTFIRCDTQGMIAAVLLAASYCKIYNNSFYNNRSAIMPWRSVSHDNEIKNNVMDQSWSGKDINGDSKGGADPAGENTAEYNFYGTGGDYSDGTGNIVNTSHDPFLYASPKSWNQLILRENSMCIDAGKDLGRKHRYALDPNDLTWAPSKIDQDTNGSGWEIGAFVFRASGQPEIAPSPPTGLRIVN